MQHTPGFCCLALLLLASCGSYQPQANTDATNQPANTGNVATSNSSATAPKPRPDFSTPRIAVVTFIEAASNRDAELLSQCFASESAGEFRKYREKRATAKELDELAKFADGAKITDVKVEGDSAVVSVAFKERNEKISMKRTESGWKILDF